jgi:integrase
MGGNALVVTRRLAVVFRPHSRVWYPARTATGLEKVTPHDLRASHATWLYDMGWSPVEIAARLGHSKATVTTKHYARRVVGRDVEIAAALDAAHAKAQDFSPDGRGAGG